MPGGELHIIANCAKRKSAPTPEMLRLGSQQRRDDGLPTRWLNAVASTSTTRMRAEDLYQGNHWSVVRQLPALARVRGWSRVTLWVASAGLGLVAADTQVASYSATFAPHDPDSVVRGVPPSERTASAAAWWRALAAARARSSRQPTTIAALVARDPSVSIAALLSPPYVGALADDLREAASQLVDPKRMVVISSAAAEKDAGELELARSGAALQPSLGGPLAALHARAARHVLQALGPDTWSTDAARHALATVATNKCRTAQGGARRSDADVRRFIARALASRTPPACSPLLEQFRASGHACEQHRFRRLYLELAARG